MLQLAHFLAVDLFQHSMLVHVNPLSWQLPVLVGIVVVVLFGILIIARFGAVFLFKQGIVSLCHWVNTCTS